MIKAQTIPKTRLLQPTSLWQLTANERVIALVVLLISLIARWEAIIPGYAVDDYVLYRDDGSSWRMTLMEGRPSVYVLFKVLSWLRAMTPGASVLGTVFSICVLIATGLFLCRLWKITDRPLACAVVVSTYSLFPYWAEILAFRTAAPFITLSYALGFASLAVVVHESRGYWITSIALMVTGIAGYQLVLNHVAMALVLAMAFHLAGRTPEEPYIPRVLKNGATVVIASTALYVCGNLLLQHLLQIAPSPRTGFVPGSELSTRVHQAIGAFIIRYFREEPIFPFATKLSLWTMTTIALLDSVGKAVREGRGFARVRQLLAYVPFILLGTPLLIGVALVVKDWWPVPRALSHAAIFWAGLAGLSAAYSTRRARAAIAVLAGIALLSFVGLNNQVFREQHRLNQQDLAKANRIVARLEQLPDFSRLQGIAVSGGTWAYPSIMQTIDGDLNISAWAHDWSHIALLNEASGYRFLQAPAGVQAKAETYCGSAPKWPDAKSVTSMDSYGVVCLERWR